MDTSGLPPWLVIILAIGAIVGAGGIGGVITQWRKDKAEAETGERSVAIVELEKAVPGLGEVITQLRAQNKAQADQIAEQGFELARLRTRVNALEIELAIERGRP